MAVVKKAIFKESNTAAPEPKHQDPEPCPKRITCAFLHGADGGTVAHYVWKAFGLHAKQSVWLGLKRNAGTATDRLLGRARGKC